ncbi:hypothetical protein P153DRAFT_390238 [Dothidotthia symphoricarpi CBS 119687]|uniref:Alpha/beta-hydrolase n=1 Tax=Dothidotthia symphoricarpi CBS 119687 TaxID=1392245 RepID=A0A6A5ZYW0_9PLEO|nr:uncharacterized protein P153DRAFT_390238 [Dothidotthia symphoricarpi CBS 119687]KAF2124770.1 hypothetical protein P153DRAFT_390238 [Dothidotthia symphoricarpi CBS 119687]
MAGTPVDTFALRDRRQSALAEIQFASIIEDDLTPSEDETPEDESLQLETAQSAIGVSIGHQQTRLVSPRTPAAEKAAALEAGDGGELFDGWELTSTTTIDQRLTPPMAGGGDDSDDGGASNRADATPPVQTRENGQAQHDGSPARLPSPWRTGPKTFVSKTSNHRASLRQQLTTGSRRRSSSGGSTMAETMRKYMPFNLPSMPKASKHLTFTLPSFSTSTVDSAGKPARRRMTAGNDSSWASLPQQDGTYQSTLQRRRSPSPTLQRDVANDSGSTLPRDDPPSHLYSERLSDLHDRPTPRLRRSNSEGSFLLHRSKSLASSLGDDTRFESVQGQVNSRLKAIRDSLQDSNFKFPSPSLPTFNFASREDMFKPRNGSVLVKSRNLDDGATQGVSYRPNVMAGTRSATTGPPKVKRSSKDVPVDQETHPFFTQALQELEGDLVVLGGYRGSILRSAEPPNRQLWVPIKVGLNLRKVDLEVPLDADADERMEETIYPDGMLTHIGPVDISKRLLKRLRASENVKNGKLRVHNYGYDWRLSPHFLSRRMIAFLESLPCNQPGVPREKRGAVIIAHSLGGLITRHAINQRPDLVAGVVYAGVPQNCVNILGPFRNGDDVLFSSRILTAQVNFTIRTSYALLPLDGKCFINKHTKEEYRVDFFDIETWKERRLSPCIAAPLPSPLQPSSSSLSVSGLLNAMSQALPTFPNRKNSISRRSQQPASGANAGSSTSEVAKDVADVARNAADKAAEGGAQTAGMGPQMSQGQHAQTSNEPNPATAVTIPYDKAVEYLTRVLAETKRFKQELAHHSPHSVSNSYPPIALIYGRSTPTVYGAKVESREAIARADVYDELAFASGDGVVLARAAMVPEGYSAVRGGVVSSERGHVTLLGDLEAVGRCLYAVLQARRGGVGMGLGERENKSKGLGIAGPVGLE